MGFFVHLLAGTKIGLGAFGHLVSSKKTYGLAALLSMSYAATMDGAKKEDAKLKVELISAMDNRMLLQDTKLESIQRSVNTVESRQEKFTDRMDRWIDSLNKRGK
jgi:hypothetical protein